MQSERDNYLIHPPAPLEPVAAAVTEARTTLEQTYLQVLEALVETLEARDLYTAGHSRRVSTYAWAIAREVGMTHEEVERVRIGALLHDIGKVGVPDYILHKPGPLTPAEYDEIKRHPTIGVRILERISRFSEYISIVGLHHENHDGSGYPYGLAGDAIPLDARIVHVADAYDAMSSNRPYRNRLREEEIREIIRAHSKTQFTPAIVDAFFAAGIDSTAPNLFR